MTFRELKKLTDGGENAHVEFKRKVQHPEKIMKEVVAFANTDGGHLLIGVDDNGLIPGLKHPDDDDFLMEQSMTDLCKPEIKFEKEFIKVKDGRVVIHYFIHPSDEKPHFAFLKKTHRYGRAFVRVADKSVQASREMRKILKLSKREQGGMFQYGENEKLLMNYLGQHQRITLAEFRKLTNLPRDLASNILVDLTVSRVLRAIPAENGDWFEPID
ncbi:MAG: ATP-binding protein [Cyclobacteriaceae bacterium]